MGTGPLRLVHLSGAADVARRLLLRATAAVLLRLLLRVDLVFLARVLATVRVLEPGVSSTAPRKFCVYFDSLSVGGWHPTSLFLGF